MTFIIEKDQSANTKPYLCKFLVHGMSTKLPHQQVADFAISPFCISSGEVFH